MYTLTIATNTLRAARTHSADKDVRFYLNSVLVAPAKGRIVATDGHRLILLDLPEAPTDAPDFVIPNDLVDAALKACKGRNGAASLAVSYDPATRDISITAGTAKFGGGAIDAKFPDWERIIPVAPPSGVHGHFNPDYIRDAMAAIRVYRSGSLSKGSYPYLGCYIVPNGPDNCAIVTDGQPGVAVLVMPVRDGKDYIYGAVAAWLGSPALARDNATAERAA